MKLIISIILLLILGVTIFGQVKVKPPADLVRFLKVKASDLTVKAVDINNDGKSEYFVNDKNSCGAGRCATYLYQRKGKTFKQLFWIDIWLDVDKGSSLGMRNLVTYDWAGKYILRSHYRWNGQEYIEFKCTEEIRYGRNEGKIKQVPCDE